MKYLDLTLPTPEENLACDEALLDSCENGHDDEILRFWEHASPFVVLGYSNKADTEADLAAARRANLPVLRRCTGGGAVVQGPGCLNFSLILRITEDSPFKSIRGTNVYIMNRHKDALSALLRAEDRGQRAARQTSSFIRHPLSLLPAVTVRGHSDLALGDLKFSGNAQRRRHKFLLFHGTFLLDVDIELIERMLPMPSRQPDYRQNRRHREFLTNLRSLSARQIKETLQTIWAAQEPLRELPADGMAALAANRYATEEWTFKF
ncbi:MAG TPA: lipoate--protein ligase family protein [Verrucomicrobiae bacterium]|nr:lipoate--protein ligase family protein [Verrucomicrobiae bacterium]